MNAPLKVVGLEKKLCVDVVKSLKML